jgi:hypothetical protein
VEVGGGGGERWRYNKVFQLVPTFRKNNIDRIYMRYFIYSISHEDKTLGTYIGSTCDFNVRRNIHKSNCNCKNNQLLYQVINSNGGFDNWNMEIIEQVDTDDKKQVYEREQYWIKQTEHKLNKRNAIFNLNEYMREWYKNNKECVLDKKKEYYLKNREKRLVYQKGYNKKKKSNNNINDCENNEVTSEDKEI